MARRVDGDFGEGIVLDTRGASSQVDAILGPASSIRGMALPAAQRAMSDPVAFERQIQVIALLLIASSDFL